MLCLKHSYKLSGFEETKDRRNLEDEDVTLKKTAGIEYCRAATAFNLKYGGKPWKYVLISDDLVKDSM